MGLNADNIVSRHPFSTGGLERWVLGMPNIPNLNPHCGTGDVAAAPPSLEVCPQETGDDRGVSCPDEVGLESFKRSSVPRQQIKLAGHSTNHHSPVLQVGTAWLHRRLSVSAERMAEFLID